VSVPVSTGATVIPACKVVKFLYQQAVNKDQTATVLSAAPDFFLTGSIGREWLTGMRSALGDFEAETGIEAVIVGAGAVRVLTVPSVLCATTRIDQ